MSTRRTIATVVTSPEAPALAALLSHVTRRLQRAGHAVTPIVLPTPLTALPSTGRTGDSDADLASAIATVHGADALVIASPGTGAAKFLLESLPPAALHEKPRLALIVGDSVVPVPDLSSANSVSVPASHLRVFADGGVLIDPASAAPIAESTDRFLAAVGRSTPPRPSGSGHRVSPVAGAPDLTVRAVQVGDPELQPLLDELVVEYGTRYAQLTPQSQLTEVPESDFLPPDGAFLLVIEDGESIAGGALRRYDEDTAEVKRVWTASRHRRRGLAHRVMAELEQQARELGYTRLHLTTGPRQPEAAALYLSSGYQPRFDVTADPETIGPLAFGKELTPGAGLVEWVQPTWAQARARYGVPAGAVR